MLAGITVIIPISGVFFGSTFPHTIKVVGLALGVAFTAGTVLLTGVIVYQDTNSIIAKTDWKTKPGRWGVLSAVVPLVGPVLYLRKRNRAVTGARQRQFYERCVEYDQKLSGLEARMQPYFDIASYLTYHAHKDLKSTHERLVEDHQQIAETTANTQGIDTNGRLDEFESRLEEIQDVLANRQTYNDNFVDKELIRRQAFFSDIGAKGYSLNRRQQEAVVRNDTYNRVIAGAGTGKTLVLTTRVAYLIKHRGVPPEEILVATFTGNATKEMEQRLQRDFDISGVEVTTLHSFGYNVLEQTQEDRPDVFNGSDREHFVRDAVDRGMKQVPDQFYDHLTWFLLYRDVPPIEETDFETREEYVETLRQKSYETLRGEKVKSRAEKVIADFLHIHQVDYRYEQRVEPINAQLRSDDRQPSFELDESRSDDTDKDAYRPDFYIPAADLYLEHFGIDEAGEVADYFETTTDEYVEKIHWARDQFAEIDATLVETYQFEFDVGRLRKALEHRLTHHGVSLNRMSYTELVDETYEMHEQAIPVWQQLSRFIELARTFLIPPSEIPSRLSMSRPAQYHFGMCGGLLLYMYEQRLTNTRSVDFPGMIHDATQAYEEKSRLAPQFEHVLVDEFQDIGQDQLHLVEALSGPDDARLFAVGDDWQSIYSFQGAIVNLFVDFEEHFGPAATSTLEINYRSPSQLVSAGASLVQHNDNQLEKAISADSDVEASVVKHLLGGYTERDHIEYTAKLAVHLVTSYLENGCDPDDIMVLCRYDNAVPYLDAVRRRLLEHGIPFTNARGSRSNDEEDENAVIVKSVH
ncbi:UvrD-helicase domain-containing protein [Saliphagus sp. GCM10025308]